jgi:putative chitinase
MSFEFDFTPEQLAQCIPGRNIGEWYQPICNVLPDYLITSKLRVAAWLAQMGHESGDLTEIEENLNYSAKGLRGVFPHYFPTDEMALEYQRQPVKIASRVYGGRMGNGPEETQEGWKYHGRGLVQITGKENYFHCSNALYGDARLIDNPELLCEQDGAIRSACWYWNSRELNGFADNRDMVTITRRINGGTIGLQERMERYERALRVLDA